MEIAIMCMNHPDESADLTGAEWGPPLCTECAGSADLEDTSGGGSELDEWVNVAREWEDEAGFWASLAQRRGRRLDELQAARSEARSGRPAQSDVGGWLAANFGGAWSSERQALVLAEEVGEVCRAVVKRAQGIRGSRAEWSTELRKELADVHLVLLALADCEGIDLDDVTGERWAAVTARDARAHRVPADAAVADEAVVRAGGIGHAVTGDR